MEYTIKEYRRAVWKVFTTSDGNKYIQSKSKDNFIYLTCVLFRDDCKGTCKLNRESDLVTPLKLHNHNNEACRNEIFALKRKCKTVAKNSQTNLRKVFDYVTRNNQEYVKFPSQNANLRCFEQEKTLEPRIPPIALEFNEIISTTSFGKNYKFSVAVGNETGVVFYSDSMSEFLLNVTNIQYAGTFFTVSMQFYQLWTIFITVGRHTLAAIHCLVPGKSQDLY